MERRVALAALAALALAALVIGLLGAPQPIGAAFPGANGKIAFVSNRDSGGEVDIYVMNSDGTRQTRLTTGDYPAWSPDGTKIVFASSRDSAYAEIYVMNVADGGVTRLTNSYWEDSTPAWSPDGTKIAFASWRDGGCDTGGACLPDIYVMNADGTNVTRLTITLEGSWGPAWSPDGTKIAFTSEQAGNYDIYVMNANGTNQIRLTSNPAFDGYPNWSPDGKKIAFASNRDQNYEIYVMNADGTNQRRLTKYSGYDVEPAWSPDGTKIAFTSKRQNNYDIYVMNAGDGTGITRLTKNLAFDGRPDWQPVIP